MTSFLVSDYKNVFQFALFIYNNSKGLKRSRAAEIMDLCETVIGQQAHRPGRSRSTTKDEVDRAAREKYVENFTFREPKHDKYD